MRICFIYFAAVSGTPLKKDLSEFALSKEDASGFLRSKRAVTLECVREDIKEKNHEFYNLKRRFGARPDYTNEATEAEREKGNLRIFVRPIEDGSRGDIFFNYEINCREAAADPDRTPSNTCPTGEALNEFLVNDVEYPLEYGTKFDFAPTECPGCT